MRQFNITTMYLSLIIMLIVTSSEEIKSCDDVSNIDNNDYRNIDNYNINIRTIINNTFEITAVIATRIYKKIIDNEFYESVECPPVLNLYRIMMRQVLEKYIHDDSKYSSHITMDFEPREIKLSFVVDLGYVKEHVTLKLPEHTHESFEQKMDNKIAKIEEELSEEVNSFKPKTYVLERIEYTDEEDKFMSLNGKLRIRWRGIDLLNFLGNI